MTRHFFALLALLSGLAALNASAHASAIDTLACASSVSASASDDAAIEAISANAPPTTVSQSTAREVPEHAEPAPAALPLPVLIGIDRAYE